MKKIVIIFTVVVLAVVLGAYFLIQHQQSCPECLGFKAFSPQVIRHYISGFGPWAILVYILLYTVNTFSPFFPPIFILSFSAGTLLLFLSDELGKDAITTITEQHLLCEPERNEYLYLLVTLMKPEDLAAFSKPEVVARARQLIREKK